jgi:hypothetical protein
MRPETKKATNDAGRRAVIEGGFEIASIRNPAARAFSLLHPEKASKSTGRPDDKPEAAQSVIPATLPPESKRCQLHSD